MSKEDGGPAFPRSAHHIPERDLPTVSIDNGENGMSTRDWFAGMALQGMLARSSYGFDIPAIATDAFRYADAMLEARKK